MVWNRKWRTASTLCSGEGSASSEARTVVREEEEGHSLIESHLQHWLDFHYSTPSYASPRGYRSRRRWASIPTRYSSLVHVDPDRNLEKKEGDRSLRHVHTNCFLIASNCSTNSLVLSSIDEMVRNASLSETTWLFTMSRTFRCDLRLASCWENICAQVRRQ